MSTGRLPRGLLIVLAVAAFSTAAVSPRPTLSAGAALVGVILLVLNLVGDRPEEQRDLIAWSGIAAIVPVLFSRFESVGPLPGSERSVRAAWLTLVLITALLAVIASRRPQIRRFVVVGGLAATVLVTGSMTLGEWNSPVGFDVYRSHQAAGDALLAGENPYGDAVQTPNGSPHAPEGSMIIGYSYPPVVLASYGLLSVLFDPRVVSAVAWLGVLVWLAKRAIGRRESDLALSVFVLVATAPVWPVVWFASWTEPLSLALLWLALILWSRRPVLSAVLLGLALASKQYFVFLAPLLLLHREEGQHRRAFIAFGTAGLTILPALIIDPGAYVTATINNLADIGFRPDTQSLSGLLAESGIDFQVPLLVWIGLGLFVSALLGRWSHHRDDLAILSALGLSFVFLAGQAFPNYWFLMMGLVGVGSVIRAIESPRRSMANGSGWTGVVEGQAKTSH